MDPGGVKPEQVSLTGVGPSCNLFQETGGEERHVNFFRGFVLAASHRPTGQLTCPQQPPPTSAAHSCRRRRALLPLPQPSIAPEAGQGFANGMAMCGVKPCTFPFPRL